MANYALVMAVLIVTTEESGLDKYSQELAARLNVKQIATSRYLSLRGGYQLSRLVRNEPDIVHLPNHHFARFALFRQRPYIVTVHDLVRFYFPFDPEGLSERLALKLDIWSIRRANHIIATSENTRKDLMKYMKIPESNITVIYDGIDHDIFKPYDVKLRLLDKPYILYVGSERPRKNLHSLYQALAILKRDFPDLTLVKVGPAGRYDKYRKNSERQLSGLGITQDVAFIDYVSEYDLVSYYRSAELLAYPSFYEGFGLPPLEAMSCGCPVVTSNASSIPEVVGDAGLLVDPRSVTGLAQAISRVLTDRKLRDNMVRKGLEQSGRFSWDKTAQQTQQVYDKVAVG